MARYKRRTDGRYQANVYIGRENGKKKYKTVYAKTEKELEKKIRDVKNQLDKGIDIISSSSAFSDCVEKWLKSLKAQVSESQYNLYDYRISVFTDELGDTPINKIKPDDLQTILNDIAVNNPTTHQPTSNRTVSRYISTVKRFYDYLVSNRYIEFNSALTLSVPNFAAPQEERRALTAEEQKRIKEFKHRAQLPAMIALLCGLRRGEITVLQWEDIDFTAKTITVVKAYDFKNKKTKGTKTENGNRVVPMPDELINFLKPIKKKRGNVVTNTEGKPMSEQAWKRLWKYYMNAMNREYSDLSDWKPTKHNKKPPMRIEPFTLHCLRHTYATILYDAGVDVLTAKKLMGHSKIETTLKIYTHLSEENEKLNINKLNEYLNGGLVKKDSQNSESA